MDKKIQTFLESKALRITLCVLGSIILALVIFQAGIVVGYHKAEYSYHFDKNYLSTFGHGYRGPGMPPIDADDLLGGHGASGKVIRADTTTLVIEDSTNVEKIITIEPTTIIRRMRDTIPASDIAPNESVIVFGSPDENGTIEANLIRVFPALPDVGTPPTPQTSQTGNPGTGTSAAPLNTTTQ